MLLLGGDLLEAEARRIGSDLFFFTFAYVLAATLQSGLLGGCLNPARNECMNVAYWNAVFDRSIDCGRPLSVHVALQQPHVND